MADPKIGEFYLGLRRAIDRQPLMTISALAEETGITRGFINQMLSEKERKLPSVETLIKLAKKLKTTPNHLLGFPDPEAELWRRRYMRLHGYHVQLKTFLDELAALEGQPPHIQALPYVPPTKDELDEAKRDADLHPSPYRIKAPEMPKPIL